MNRHQIWIVGGGLLIFGLLAFFTIGSMLDHKTAEQRAIAALQNKESSEGSQYIETEYYSEGIGTCGAWTISKKDFKKTKIAGEFVGSKSKEFVKSVWSGLTK